MTCCSRCITFDFVTLCLMYCDTVYSCFFFNDTATTEIYTYSHTLSLHDALPISIGRSMTRAGAQQRWITREAWGFYTKSKLSIVTVYGDRKSTRLNSSH